MLLLRWSIVVAHAVFCFPTRSKEPAQVYSWWSLADRHWHTLLVYLSYLQRLLKFSREEALSCSFWYLPLHKNSAFNKVNIHEMLTEWIHESHRLLSFSMTRNAEEILEKVSWVLLHRNNAGTLQRWLPRRDFASSTILGLTAWCPSLMRIVVCRNWLIFRYRRKYICEIGIASEWL